VRGCGGSRCLRADVTQTLKRMVKDGYVHMNAQKEIGLTPAVWSKYARSSGGTARGTPPDRHPRFDWLQAHVEAVKFQHVLSPEVATAISRTLGDPLTCPHGNRSPATSG